MSSTAASAARTRPRKWRGSSADVVALHPDLVIWQVGTNAVLRRDDLSADGESLRAGVAMLKNAGIDVVLMDLQYAPRVHRSVVLQRDGRFDRGYRE